MPILIKHSQRTLRKPCTECGSTDLYFAHDPDDVSPWTSECADCTEMYGYPVKGELVLMERNGDRHMCGITPRTTDDTTKDTPDVQPLPTPMPTPAPAPATPDPDAALNALKALLTPPTVDEAAIKRIVADTVTQHVFPTRTVIVRDNVRREIEGDTHAQLGDVATALLAGEHVMMVGPAGTGKSTIAEQAADALGIPSYSLSLSPQTPASAIIGYMQAAGEYVRTLFREAYENGGLFHFDEVDNSHPSVLAVINAALANGHMAFPDGMVKRHSDFRAVASANTYGRGATRAYVGRQAMDAATLDRFTVITIDIDEALENALCYAQSDDARMVEKVLNYVRKLRKSAERNGLNVVVSPRASVGMVRLLSAGLSWDTAVDARVRRGLDDATWAKLNG